jgi:hypothetical protein
LEKSKAIKKDIYGLVKTFPAEEKFRLVDRVLSTLKLRRNMAEELFRTGCDFAFTAEDLLAKSSII